MISNIQEKLQSRSFDQPDEVREFPKGKVELVTIADSTIGRAKLLPGWKWSECVKPLAGTHNCEASHFLYQLSGVMRTVMDDGTEVETRAGNVCIIPPGHDAWVIGEEPVVVVDFQGMTSYAK